MDAARIGSEQHKQLFCRAFIDTHEPYEPRQLSFPDLDDASRKRLLSLPIWDEAVNTERETAAKVGRMADAEPDGLMREAIALQAFEEHRHAKLLDLLTERYGIPVTKRESMAERVQPAWDFIRTEYGECFDAFFAFGLFALARESGVFPPALVELFEPVMQEEARHVLFFVNWIAYRRARLGFPERSLLDARRMYAVALQILSRMRTAFSLSGVSAQDNFAMNSHESMGDLSLRTFLETCLRENDLRLGLYDAALVRPRFARHIARLALRFMPA